MRFQIRRSFRYAQQAMRRVLLEMYRRQLSDEKIRRKLQRFEKRLRTVASQLQRMHTEENEARLAS